MSTAALAVKDAIYSACVTLFPDCQVTYGVPNVKAMRDDIVAVMGLASTSETGPMGTGRKRDETLDVDVIISCYRGGADQQAVTAIAAGYLDTLDSALRGASHNLGNVVRYARITNYELGERFAVSEEKPAKSGRVAEIFATVHCQARI